LAKADKEYLNLRYPPSALYELTGEKRKIYSKYNIPQVFKNGEIKITRFTVNINFLLLILKGESSPPNNIKQTIYSQLMYDFFWDFGFIKWVNFRALLSFIKRYLAFKLINVMERIKKD
jgi:hypothetical protein